MFVVDVNVPLASSHQPIEHNCATTYGQGMKAALVPASDKGEKVNFQWEGIKQYWADSKSDQWYCTRTFQLELYKQKKI